MRRLLLGVWFIIWMLQGCESRERSETLARNETNTGALSLPSTSVPAAPVSVSPAKKVTLRVGVLEGDDNQIFGKIRDIAVDSKGNLFVLDDQSLTVRWFDNEGRFRGSAGRAGGGPGEFRAPMALALDEVEYVQVLDAAHSRIDTFAPTDSGLTLVNTLRSPLHALAFCRIGSRYFLLAPQAEAVIHEMSSNGDLLQSFGAPIVKIPENLRAHESIMRESGSRGRLCCTRAPDRVILVPAATPVVRAFSPEGKLVWSVALANYHASRYEPKGRGFALMPDPKSGTAHSALYMARLGKDVLGVTLHEGSLANPEGKLELRTLSLVDGHEIRASGSSMIVAAKRGLLEYGFVNHPFPQITVTSFEPPK